MKKLVLALLGIGLIAVIGIGGAAAMINARGIPSYEPGDYETTIEVTPERVERGRKIASVLCAECHKNPSTGKLTGQVMFDIPPEFGKVVTRNITQDKKHGIGEWTDGELVYLLRTGIKRDGSFAPPPMVKLHAASDEDIYAVIAYLRSDDPAVQPEAIDPPGESEPTFLMKMLCTVAFKPFEFPTEPVAAPEPSDKVAFGAYLMDGLMQCYECHSADFKTNNQGDPPMSPGYYGGGTAMIRFDGGNIFTSNITMDEETGIGKWTEDDFKRAMRSGFRPDGTLINYPMVPYGQSLTDEELSAMWAYLQTVPKISNVVAEPSPPFERPTGSDEGRIKYYTYGCNSCHGDNGVGIGDVRRAKVDFPEDEELEKWIRDAPSIRPGTKMPKWDGVIAEEDYAPLIAYVRRLGDE